MENNTPPLLDILRNQLDLADYELLCTLAKRFSIVADIAEYKHQHQLSALDTERFAQMMEYRNQIAKAIHLSPTLVQELFELLHKHSLVTQQKRLDEA